MGEIELSNEVKATEIHERATAYYRASEQFGYKFLMEVKTIRDEKLFKELNCEDFAEYTEYYFGYNSDTINLRIQDANNWKGDYTEALRSFGKHKTRQLGLMPEKERKQIIKDGVPTDEGVKPVQEATTRELEEYKKKLKQRDEQLEEKDKQIQNLSETIVDMDQRKPKEVVPHDYPELQTHVNNLKKRNDFIESQYQKLLEERKEVNEKSSRYDQLTEAIQQAQGNLNDTQKMISDYKELSHLLKSSNEFLTKAGGLVYLDLSEVMERDSLAMREFQYLIERLERFLKDLKAIKKENILEGEIINE